MSENPNVPAGWSGIRLLAAFALIFSLGFASGYGYIAERGEQEELVISESGPDCSGLFLPGSSAAVGTAAENEKEDAERSSGYSGAVLSATAGEGADSSPESYWQFAASKNSTLYHTRDCSFVKRIKPENLVTFSSAAEAEASGKDPHSCVGG